MTPRASVEQISSRLLAALPDFSASERRLGLTLYRVLTRGAPVRPEQLAAELALPTRRIVEILDRQHFRSLVYRSGDGGIAGFAGLAVEPMAHTLDVNGRRLFTWCAWDALFITPILGATARVTSRCPQTAVTIDITVSPSGIETAEPADAVMSFLVPDTSAFDGDAQATMASFCRFVYFLASPEAATSWTAKHPDTVVLSLAEAFALGQLLNATRWGIEPA